MIHRKYDVELMGFHSRYHEFFKLSIFENELIGKCMKIKNELRMAGTWKGYIKYQFILILNENENVSSSQILVKN